jgi:hypothetical protein
VFILGPAFNNVLLLIAKYDDIGEAARVLLRRRPDRL